MSDQAVLDLESVSAAYGPVRALENVSLPLELSRRPEARALQQASAALEEVGLAARAAHLPHQLSGGEAQRVAIARALVVRPQILFADEPSGNLDRRTGEEVMDLLMQLAEKSGMTMLLVTHNTDLARRCVRVLELKEGKLHTR